MPFVVFGWEIKDQDQWLHVYGLVNSLHIWTVILSILGFARRHLNAGSALLRYVTPAVYPFDILHQTTIVSSGYFVVQWPIPVFVKFWLLAIICFGSLAVLYHFVIRRNVLTRVVFGLMKPRAEP